MTHPIGEDWIKCPSVTSGGKPYFWFRYFGNKRQWYTWDRQDRRWKYECETTDGFSKEEFVPR